MVLAITNTEPSSNPSEGGDVSCRVMVNEKGDVNDKTNDIKINNSDNDLIWREHTQHDLPPIPSPSNEEPCLLKKRETTVNHTYDTNRNEIPSSASASNHTRLTLATTRSSRSTDSNEIAEDPILLFDASDSSNAETQNDRSPDDRAEPSFVEVVESQSSASQAPVIRNWATKYDTEDKDNYDSEEGEENASEGLGDSETREDIEDDPQEQQDIREAGLTATMPEIEETSIWTCGVSELIAEGEISYHPTPTLKDHQEFEPAKDQDDDEESSSGCLFNTFHPKDDVDANENMHGTTRMVGSIPLSPAKNCENDVSADPIVPANENKSETGTLTVQESMAAELDPLVFELDNLSSQEMEEEVIFQEENDREENHFEEEVDSNDDKEIPADSPQSLAVVANDDTGEGDELFSKVTDAISSLCLTPRAQQQLLEDDSNLGKVDAEESADSKSVTITTSSTPDDPNIEVELHRGSNDDDIDKIIVVDAVVKALRKSKKKSNQKKEPVQSPTKRSKQKNDDIAAHLANNRNAPKRISSDAMDVLMSLTLMECCRSDNDNLSEMPTTSKSASILAANNSESAEVSEIEPMDILMALNADITSNIPDYKRRNSDDDNETSQGCRDAIAVARAADKESGDSVVLNEDLALIEEPKPDEEIQIMEEKKSKGSLKHNEMDRNEMESPSIGELLRGKRVTTTIIEGQNCNEAKQRVVTSHDFHPDSLVLEKLGQIGDSDSFSIDGFCDKSFSDDNPIRANPTTMLNNKKPKASKHKLKMVPLRGDGNNNPTFSGLSTTTSSSFEHLLSLSSSEDCRIPSPPQHPNKVATSNQKKEKEILASSKAFTLSLDPLPLQNLGLPPMQNLPSATPLGELLPSVSPPLASKSRKKKKKGIASRGKSVSPPFSNHCPVPSPSLPMELTTGTIKKPSALGDTRQNKSLLHLATNKMIRNAKKTNTARKIRMPKIQKTTSQKFKEKPLRLDIGSIAEDSLRMGRKVYLLPSPTSSSSTKFDSFQNHNLPSENENQENCFPSPCQDRLSMPKGIMRVKCEGDPKTPSNHNLSVHWDEKQLANKVEKGIMVGVSKRKCRPIRVLQKHWLEITAVQNGYGSELEQILGLKTTAQGYIC